MITFVIILAILIIILFLPIAIKAKVNYDLIENVGYITGKFFFIRVFLIKFKIYGNYVYIYSKKNYEHRYKIISGGPPSVFSDILLFEVLKIIKFRTLKLYASVGSADNAYLAAMACSGLRLATNIMFSYIKTKKPKAIIKTGVYPQFYKNTLLVAGASSVRFNLFKILVCFLKSVHIYINEGVKNGQRA